jgi:hypothetical protein
MEVLGFTSYIKALKCRECGVDFPPVEVYVCEDALGF